MSDRFPRRFGRYTLVANLAQGGMGALYLACQGETGMEKLCVVKTVIPHLADKEYIARFRDEAKVVVRLSHGNLVPVFDAGLAHTETGDELYIAMEHIDGKDLRAVWNRCAQKGVPFPVDIAVYIAREVARGLYYAHTMGAMALVHRDVSPPNLLLSFNGEVKLTDFGLAASTMKTEKTAPGVIYGKVSYMSPEQARSEPLDGRSDLYAVGIILWELLTGKQLFPQTEVNLLQNVRSPSIVPPSTYAPRVPPALDAIVKKALAKERDERYANCEEFRAALAGFLAQTAPTTDNHRVATFLEQLFGREIEDERKNRQQLLDSLAAQNLASQPIPSGLPVAQPSGENTPIKGTNLLGTYLDGRYLVKRMLGEGGMGRVYEAEHVEIGRRVAVKVLHSVYTKRSDVVARFRAEARAATRIGHPHIVEVFDSGTTIDGGVFFVMEFLDGRDLGDALAEDGPLPFIRAIVIIQEICLALAAAHKIGIVHRDLKPENIFLTPLEGRADFVKVLDFGIAKTLDELEGPKARLTNPGMAIGTPEYMAPEQAAGMVSDQRVDIYALGAILYETLTGKAPYHGKNLLEILTKKATEPPPPLSRFRQDVPRELEQLMYQMMAPVPDQRPQSMDNVAQQLEVIRLQFESGATVAPQRRFDLGKLVLGSGVLAMAVVLGLFVKGLFQQANLRHAAQVAEAPAAAPAAPVKRRPDPVPVEAPPETSGEEPAPAPAPVATTEVRGEAHSAKNPPKPHRADVRPTRGHAPANEPPASAAIENPRDVARREMIEAKGALAQGRYGDAESLFQKIYSSGQERGQALTGLGEVAFKQGQYNDAVRFARRAVDAGGGLRAKMVLGNSYFKLQQYDEAIEEYRSVLQSNHEHAEARANLQAAEKKRGN